MTTDKVAGTIQPPTDAPAVEVKRVPEALVTRFIELNERKISFKALAQQAENEYNQLVQLIQKNYGQRLDLVIEATVPKEATDVDTGKASPE